MLNPTQPRQTPLGKKNSQFLKILLQHNTNHTEAP